MAILTRKVGLDSVDCVVCEPDLGPALSDVPTIAYAERIIQKLEPLFYSFIEQAYGVLKPQGKLVMVTPCIGTRSKSDVNMPVDEQLDKVGFKRLSAFTPDMFAEDLDVGRLRGLCLAV